MDMVNYRVAPEIPDTEKGGPYVPGYRPEIPRSLVLPRPDVLPAPPGAEATLPMAQLPRELRALAADAQKMVLALDAVIRARPLQTMEYPFQSWRVDRVTLTNTAVVWLDQFNPIVAGQQRFMPGRRAVILVNHNLAANVFIRHIDGGVAAQGGFIAAGGSITLPLGERCSVYATGVAATGMLSFYQFS